MISTNDLRKGIIIELDNSIHLVVESQHIKPGKGSAFVRATLKNLKDGSIVERTLNAGVKVKLAEVTERKMQYMYSEKDSYCFMDLESYEQIPITKEQLSDYVGYLKENIVVTLLFHNSTVVGVTFPTTVDLKVTETAPSNKGDTVSGGGKPATLETGKIVTVPFFVNQGDRIKVDTRTGQYVERILS